MSQRLELAQRFFDACESGKGWDACKAFCTPGATFSAQAHSLHGIDSLDAYTNWLQGIYAIAPDAGYEILGFAEDAERDCVLGFGVFRATHTEEGGPVPPTGKAVAAEYVYIMKFDGDKIGHMTKVWNDVHSFQQLGWA